jgi:hypothetical protein
MPVFDDGFEPFKKNCHHKKSIGILSRVLLSVLEQVH